MVLALPISELRGTVFMEREAPRTNEEQTRRDEQIFSAMLMGNNYSQEVTLMLDTNNGPRYIRSRIWATTDKHIMLHSGDMIPRKAILEIEY